MNDRRKDDFEKIKYESIFKFFADALILFDPEKNKIIDVNDNAVKLFQYNKETLINCDMKTSPNNSSYILIKDFLNNNDSMFFKEIKLFIKDKVQIITEIKAINFTVKNYTYILLNIKDITKQKEKDFQLKRNKEFIESIIEVIPDDLNIINENKKIIWSNNPKLLDKMVCKDFHKNHCKKHKNNSCYIDKVFKTGKNIEFETNYKNKYYWHIITPCNENSHINSVLEIRRDITEKKKISELDEIRSIVDRINMNQTTLKTKITEIKNEST